MKISLILVEIFLVSAVSGFDARGARAALPKKRDLGPLDRLSVGSAG